jgi:hypothetical protein
MDIFEMITNYITNHIAFWQKASKNRTAAAAAAGLEAEVLNGLGNSY